MGGGARTFPGGLNKWQWKRLHEKKAREKEKLLLEQEKQIYQARIRSQIRAKVTASQNSDSGADPDQQGANYSPLSPQEHIKALADRFMKEGAEDLWNEDDGPIKAPAPQVPKRRVIGEPIDIRQLIPKNYGFAVNAVNESGNWSTSRDNSMRGRNFSSGSMGSVGLGYNLKGHCGYGNLVHSNNWLIRKRFLCYMGRSMRVGMERLCGDESGISMNLDSLMTLRSYSVDTRSNKRRKTFNFARNESSTSEDESGSEGNEVGSLNYGRVRWPRFQLSENGSNLPDSDDEDGNEESESRGKVKRMMSSAALGKHDIKIKKKVPLEFLEEEDDLSEQVEMIRQEVRNRNLEEHEVGKIEEETVYSSKRYARTQTIYTRHLICSDFSCE